MSRPTRAVLPLLVLWGAALLAAGLVVFAFQFRQVLFLSPRLVVALFVVPAAAALASAGVALFGSREWRATGALTVVAVVLAAYGAEGALAWKAAVAPAPAKGERAGAKAAAVRELAQASVKAYPAPSPRILIQNEGGPIAAPNGPVLPLGGVADVPTVFCDEGYGHIVYRSDGFGFRNPAEAWQGTAEVVAIGDSFTQGACVADGDTMVDPLRARWRTVNLGIGGNGPLLDLATLAEYGPVLKPRLVLWVFCEDNDLTEILFERAFPLLTGYLEGRGQGLAARREEVSQALAAFYDANAPGPAQPSAAAAPAQPAPPPPAPATGSILALHHLRAGLGLYHMRLDPEAMGLFVRTMERAKAVTESWGGRMLFVHLPSRPRVAGGVASGYTRAVADFVNEVVARQGIAVVDLGYVLDAEPVADDFFSPANIHFSDVAYRKLGQALVPHVAKALER